MAYWDDYFDAGSHSLTACDTMDRQHRLQTGPISGRTRSRTTSRQLRRSKDFSDTTPKTSPSSGSFSPSRKTKRIHSAASIRLCQRRSRLTQRLEKIPANERSGFRTFALRMQLRQLQVTTEGALNELPVARARAVKKPEEVDWDRL
ncbi:hypothetical protein T440DRAFT_528498 [Plenodomus tracheiphilus IPT5]|uniref:Uncharacterized protein n=1 Tax=Plenodomus tracheiphilus IPT5 TaxID=1408161 RepID=A0A6A7B998_9PLEO|nr:hypothetical protein T440DRAFT_528498 [Plenodomus tracheiphilus IPT5]